MFRVVGARENLDARRVLLPLSRLLHRVQPVHLPSVGVYYTLSTGDRIASRGLLHVVSRCSLRQQVFTIAISVSRSSSGVHRSHLILITRKCPAACPSVCFAGHSPCACHPAPPLSAGVDYSHLLLLYCSHFLLYHRYLVPRVAHQLPRQLGVPRL